MANIGASKGTNKAYSDYINALDGMMVTKKAEVYNNPQFGEIRTVTDESGEPWFCLTDICEALGLTAKGVKQRLDDEVISNYPITDTLGREQQALYVNEDGLYDTILESRKPEAKIFRKWITSEVLPSIRKTGQYAVKPLTPAQQLLANAQMLVEMEQRQLEQERQQKVLESRQATTEHRVNEIEERIKDNTYMTVMGFANIHRLKIGTKALQRLGRQCSTWCRRMGMIPEQTKHEKWGHVNTYPMQALKAIFKANYPDKSAMFDIPTYWG